MELGRVVCLLVRLAKALLAAVIGCQRGRRHLVGRLLQYAIEHRASAMGCPTSAYLATCIEVLSVS